MARKWSGLGLANSKAVVLFTLLGYRNTILGLLNVLGRRTFDGLSFLRMNKIRQCDSFSWDIFYYKNSLFPPAIKHAIFNTLFASVFRESF